MSWKPLSQSEQLR
jgi:hypothetical protein